MRIEVRGAADCFRLAHALNEAGQRGLKRELDKGSRQAGQVIADAVLAPASLNQYIPQNFERRFGLAVNAKVEVRLVQSRRITVVVYATGKRERRDIRAMNRGVLRHPVYGRMRRLKDGTLQANPWVVQAIRPGLVDEPARAAMPKAVEKIENAVTRVVDKIGRS